MPHFCNTPPASIAAVVLNYRTPEDTRRAVDCLLRSARYIDDIIVINNDHGSRFERSLGWPNRVRLFEAGENLGYSGGMNIGIRAALSAGAERVLVMNSDVTVPSDCIGEMEQCLLEKQSAGIVGPVVLTSADDAIIESLGVSYCRYSGRVQLRGFHTSTSALRSKNAAVDAVSGCCMLISRDVFAAIGYFDEDYFFSFEDLDFCLRAGRAGFLVVLAASARVRHVGALSIGAKSPRRLYFAARNHLLTARRAGAAASRWSSAARTTFIVVLNVAHACRSNSGSLTTRLSAVARGTADYFAGRFGADAEALTQVQSPTTTMAASVADSL